MTLSNVQAQALRLAMSCLVPAIPQRVAIGAICIYCPKSPAPHLAYERRPPSLVSCLHITCRCFPRAYSCLSSWWCRPHEATSEMAYEEHWSWNNFVRLEIIIPVAPLGLPCVLAGGAMSPLGTRALTEELVTSRQHQYQRKTYESMSK